MADNSCNEQDLKTKINIANINSSKYYYTLCKKQANTISLISNTRLIVLNEKQGIFYYVNEPTKIPFNVQAILTKPKKEIVNLNISIVKGQSKSKVLTIQFNKKADNNKPVGGQWNFTMETEQLAEKWRALIKSIKQDKTAKALQINKQSAGNVNDVLSFGLVQQSRKQQGLNVQQSQTQQMKIQQSNIKQNQSFGLDRYSNRLDESLANKSRLMNKTDILSGSKQKQKQNPPNLVTSSLLTENKKIVQSNLPSKSLLDKSLINSKINQKQPNRNTIMESRGRLIQKQPIISNDATARQSKIIGTSVQNTHPELKKSQSIKMQKSDLNRSLNRSFSSKDFAGDWNLKFLQQRNQKTIQQFSQFALSVFMELTPTDITLRSTREQEIQPKTGQRKSIRFYYAQCGSKAAKKLKRQFNNYHFILQSCRENTFINVPLCCIIQYLGFVCLAKASFPPSAQKVQNLNSNSHTTTQILQQLRTLQLFTKVSSQSIKKQATILDLSKLYGALENSLTIYLDNIADYLPDNPQSISPYQFPIRSQLMLDNFSKVINPRIEQSRQQISEALKKSINELCEVLSQHQELITSYNDLKELMHEYGINTKLISRLYTGVKSRLNKKFLHTAMLCRIVKLDIQRTMADFRETKQAAQLPEIIQEAFRIYCENQSNQKDEAWKNIAQEFKKKYRVTFNINEVEPGFFLSCLMAIVPAEYNIQMLDKTKKFFEDTGIVLEGFLVKLKPKVKNYDKFRSEKIEKLMNLCRGKKNNINQINNIVDLKNPQQICLAKHEKNKFYTYLSNHISPFSPQSPAIHKQIFPIVNSQPPTITSHEITLNYVKFCLSANKIDEYKKVIENSVDIITYWLGDDNPLLCDIFQSLSDYYGRKGDSEGSINFMKQALTTCIRSTGTHTSRSANQYFKLAQRQLKYGEKENALENYYKAKLNMEGLGEKDPQYTILLMKIASIQLSEGNVEKCIGLAIKSIKSSEDKNIPDTFIIKIYQLLSRAYELNTNKPEMKNLAHLTAKVFNNTQNQYTFDQMVRVCATGFIMTLLPGKQEKLEEYLSWLKANCQLRISGKESINRLMALSQNSTIMQKFARGLDSIEKYVAEAKNNRTLTHQSKELKNIFELIIGVIGFDFVQGVLGVAKFW